LSAPTPSLGPKQLATRFRDQVHAAVDRVFGELVIGAAPIPETKPLESVIVLPTAAEIESLLSDVPDEAADVEDDDSLDAEEINGDGPTEPLKTVGQSEKPTVFNEPIKFVTRDGPADHREVRRNQIRAQRAAARKQTRPAPALYQAECSGCNRTFETPRKPTPGLGQKCPRCIRNMEKPER
jgi:hypothetical protein